jgi:hypothetical protein
MSYPKQPEDKGAAKETKEKKPLEYRRFEELLKKVIKAPPMRNGTKRLK